MIYFVDIDNTICLTEGDDYENAQPILARINKINRLFDAGHTVVYWTGRGVGTKRNLREQTEKQLKEWGVRYSELRLDKPVIDINIDDCAVPPSVFFREKTAAIVGSAAYMEGKGMGALIDSADLVVRVNLGYSVIAGREADLGRRTDVIYLCGSMWRNRRLYEAQFPAGAMPVKVRQNIPGAQDATQNYVANTGVRAALDYAIQGYEIFMYGMDFYAGSNGGVVPDAPLSKRQPPKTVKPEKIYMEGYRGKPRVVTIGHIGGRRDLRLLLDYARKYSIHFDPFMSEVVKNNTPRTAINTHRYKKESDV